MITITIVTALTALLGVLGMRARQKATTPQLGWMSEQWLAEHRAIHSS